MNCDNCGQKASVFLTQITNGEMKKHAFCESCADEKGVSDPLNMSSDEAFFSDPQEVIGEDSFPLDTILEQATGDSSQSCDACGFTLSDLQKIGRLGCPECYSVFRSELLPNLSKMHKGISHVGEAPAGRREALAREEMRQKLDRDLAKAIEEEDYEKAAQLRDAITKNTGSIS